MVIWFYVYHYLSLTFLLPIIIINLFLLVVDTISNYPHYYYCSFSMIIVCQLLIVIGITYFNIGICTNHGGGGVLLFSLSPYFLFTGLNPITRFYFLNPTHLPIWINP